MATIGTFTAITNGFNGAIKALNFIVRIRIKRVENPTDKGPHFRIFSGPSNWVPPGKGRPARPMATISRSS